jgi:hypothetical protein
MTKQIGQSEFLARLQLALKEEIKDEKVNLIANERFLEKTGIKSEYLETVGVPSWTHEGETFYGARNIENNDDNVKLAKEDLFTKLLKAFIFASFAKEIFNKEIVFPTRELAESFVKDARYIIEEGEKKCFTLGQNITTKKLPELLDLIQNKTVSVGRGVGKNIAKLAIFLAGIGAVAGLFTTNIINNTQQNTVEPIPTPTPSTEVQKATAQKASPTNIKASTTQTVIMEKGDTVWDVLLKKYGIEVATEIANKLESTEAGKKAMRTLPVGTEVKIINNTGTIAVEVAGYTASTGINQGVNR